ncbi:isoprenylcysteine carboxyl methyltransferase family protein [Actinobacillus equuli subsp. haemolyticus]|uniref:isoprenylcysteine carboxyl methyltransferase family protein n=1 Tax=Actinobacillus equuli TaxID=718 RepID=UPI002441C2AE|nr:isoprenylcysteine carboxyl methyltransferase family protein [Actinobacillus equuli]WGE67154.1 isoprenylcysteine carboxyl methyltransferase family protein [Actinobacillus equuli subsp. haemolyticus]
MLLVNLTFISFFIVRLYSLSISIRNEKALIQKGATQHGSKNSKLLSIVHVLFYFSALFEANYLAHHWDYLSTIGTITLFFAYIALFWVINELKEIWTVKLYILPNHKINTSTLFRTIKHPNYFLNIIPELIGVVLLCHAWNILMYLFPVYLVVLGIRIYQEEKVMKPLFEQIK